MTDPTTATDAQGSTVDTASEMRPTLITNETANTTPTEIMPSTMNDSTTSSQMPNPLGNLTNLNNLSMSTFLHPTTTNSTVAPASAVEGDLLAAIALCIVFIIAIIFLITIVIHLSRNKCRCCRRKKKGNPWRMESKNNTFPIEG